VQYPSNVTFQDGAIELLGTTLEPEKAVGGKPLKVTNYYKVNRALEGEWHLFVHLGVQNGQGIQNAGNRDHEPVDGLYPVSQWKAGDIVADTWSLNLPPNAPPQIVVLVGFWHDSVRLPVDMATAQGKTDGQNAALAASFPVGNNQLPLPTYTVTRTTGPIAIDGKLDDAPWQKAASTGPFVGSNQGGPTHSECSAKLLYDDAFLYVAYDVHDDDIWGTHLKRDDPIYGEEVVEIFIDADGDGRTYNELEVSPHNVIFDAAFEERRKDLDKAMLWDSGMESAVQIQGTIDDPSDVDRGWTVEMKIPIKNLYAVPHTPPQSGDVWRFNLYRLDWYNNRKVNEGQAYSPLYIGDFHNLPRFAYLKFE
jgi:hypothetical protein